MSDNKKYIIVIKKQRVKVSEAVYRAYHKEREAERYQNKLIHQEQLGALWTALQSLLDDERSLIDELFFNKKSESQVAKSIGVNQSTVSRRLSKILTRLKNLMERIFFHRAPLVEFLSARLAQPLFQSIGLNSGQMPLLNLYNGNYPLSVHQNICLQFYPASILTIIIGSLSASNPPSMN